VLVAGDQQEEAGVEGELLQQVVEVEGVAEAQAP